jgi:hypothetical protein
VPPSGPPLEITRDSTLIGRDPACDLVLADGSISRRHARIEKRGDGWIVADQGSANGTFVESVRIGESALVAGKELRLGALPFRIEILGQAEVDLSATMAGEPGATMIQPVSAPPVPAAQPPARVPASPAPPRMSSAPPPPPAAPPLTKPEPRPSGMPTPAGAPASKGRGPVFYIGAGCCGCLILLLLLSALFFGGLYVATKGPTEAARAQLAEIKAGEMDAAYERLSRSYQLALAPEEFARFVAAHPSLRDNADSTFSSRSVQLGSAQLGGSLVSAAGDREQVTYVFVKEDGDWKIADIRFVGDDIRVPDLDVE